MERASIVRIYQFFFGLVVASAIFLSFPKAFADKFNTETSASARALGMGSTGVNTERGPYSVFYNPANLAAKDTGVNIQALNIQTDVSDGWLSRTSSGQFSNFNNLSSLYGDLKTNKNTYVSGRYSVYPNVTLRNFSLGMIYEVNQGAEVRASDDALRVKARNRAGLVGALSFRLFSGILRFGASAQLLSRGDADSFIAAPINATALDFKRSINSGTGLSKSAGITLSLPFRFLPSFSLVARDIGGTKYSGSGLVKWGDGSSLPVQPMTLDFGSSLTIYLARRAELKLAFDYRDYVNKLVGGNFRHMFVGGEMTFYDVLKFRAGIAHGYMSYGFGLHTKKASLDLAAYADEKDDRLRGSPEQRYVFQYTWNLGY